MALVDNHSKCYNCIHNAGTYMLKFLSYNLKCIDLFYL